MTEKQTAMPYLFDGDYTPWLWKDPQPLLEAKRRKVWTFEGRDIFLASLSGVSVLFYFTEDGSRLQYINQLRKVKLSGSSLDLEPGVFQESVKRGTTETLLDRKLPREVFWKFLIEGRRVAISDDTHSQAGKAFWEGRILESLSKGFKVLALDSEYHKPTNMVKVFSETELLSARGLDKFYSTDQDLSGDRWRFAIVT